jgi:hypothetical protein
MKTKRFFPNGRNFGRVGVGAWIDLPPPRGVRARSPRSA